MIAHELRRAEDDELLGTLTASGPMQLLRGGTLMWPCNRPEKFVPITPKQGTGYHITADWLHLTWWLAGFSDRWGVHRLGPNTTSLVSNLDFDRTWKQDWLGMSLPPEDMDNAMAAIQLLVRWEQQEEKVHGDE